MSVRRVLLLAATAATAAGAAGAAPAADAAAQTSFRGVTGQGRALTFVVDDEGRVGTVTTSWKVRCGAGRRFPEQTTPFAPPARGGTRDRVVGVGRYRLAGSGGRIGRVSLRLTGRRSGPAADPVRQQWTGRLRVRITVRRHGRPDAPCSLSVPWRARAEGIGTGSWQITGEGEAFAGLPATSSAPGPLEVTGEPGLVLVDGAPPSGSWEASFRAPALNRLEDGRRYEPGSVPGAADFTAGETPSRCDPDGGAFTVQRIRFDRLRRLVALSLTYEQRCTDDDGIVRGAITWTAANP